MINVHASLLPRWRGAAPIQRAVIAGDRETGVTIMRVVKAWTPGRCWRAASRPIGRRRHERRRRSRPGTTWRGAARRHRRSPGRPGRVPEIAQDESLVDLRPEDDARRAAVSTGRSRRRAPQPRPRPAALAAGVHVRWRRPRGAAAFARRRATAGVDDAGPWNDRRRARERPAGRRRRGTSLEVRRDPARGTPRHDRPGVPRRATARPRERASAASATTRRPPALRRGARCTRSRRRRADLGSCAAPTRRRRSPTSATARSPARSRHRHAALAARARRTSIAQFASRLAPDSIATDVRAILRLGAYQLLHLIAFPRPPSSTTRSSSPAGWQRSAAGFVNAVLRAPRPRRRSMSCHCPSDRARRRPRRSRAGARLPVDHAVASRAGSSAAGSTRSASTPRPMGARSTTRRRR